MQTRLEADKITIAATTCGTRSLSNSGANRTNASKLSKETVAQLVDALVPAFALQIGSQQSMRHLSTTADAPNDIQVMWTESTTGMPVVVPAAACWRTSYPSFEEVWSETSKLSAKGGQEYSPSSVLDC
jgi:hypothetical protein